MLGLGMKLRFEQPILFENLRPRPRVHRLGRGKSWQPRQQTDECSEVDGGGFHNGFMGLWSGRYCPLNSEVTGALAERVSFDGSEAAVVPKAKHTVVTASPLVSCDAFMSVGWLTSWFWTLVRNLNLGQLESTTPTSQGHIRRARRRKRECPR